MDESTSNENMAHTKNEDDMEGIDVSNIVTGKRTRKQTVRYEDEAYYTLRCQAPYLEGRPDQYPYTYRYNFITLTLEDANGTRSFISELAPAATDKTGYITFKTAAFIYNTPDPNTR